MMMVVGGLFQRLADEGARFVRRCPWGLAGAMIAPKTGIWGTGAVPKPPSGSGGNDPGIAAPNGRGAPVRQISCDMPWRIARPSMARPSQAASRLTADDLPRRSVSIS